MNHIFISYSRKDEKQVTRFAKSLRNLKFEIWQDISGKRSGIPYSVKWFEVIEEAIFTASGAIIFKTETWERSVPCQEEFERIQNTALPYMYVPMDRLQSEEAAVINEAARWCREQIASQENSYCRWMLSGAYRTYRKLPIEAYFPTGKHLIRNCLWLKKCIRISRQKNFQGTWVKDLNTFLRKAKNKLFWDAAGRILIGTFLFIILCWVLVVLEVFQMAQISNFTTTAGAIFASNLQRIGAYDPVQAIQLIEEFHAATEEYAQNVQKYGNEEYILRNQGDAFADYVSWNYYTQNRILADLVSRNYPTAFYESVSDCPVDIANIEETQANSHYTITLSNDTSQAFIYDSNQDTTRQLLLAAVPKAYCFSENELIIAAANQVYVYDLSGEIQPRLLTYNFENISGLVMFENKIYATTENNHVVVWNNPLLERKIHRQNIASGELIQLDDGQVMAVYVDNDCLIKNIDNNEEIYPLPFEGIVDTENISVSSHCNYAAISYIPDERSSDWIGLVDLTNGKLQQTYDIGCNIVGYTFSENDDFLITTCYDKYKIARIDLETGQIQESVGDTFSNPYSIITYESKILVCDASGMLNVYDDNLRLNGDYRAIGYPAPQKQLAVSPKYDCLLTAGRGGNALGGSFRTWLSSDKQAIFVPVDGEPMISTTSVAVTSNGDYAAYGNTDGSIYIWDVGAMEQVRNEHCIPESIIHLLFSDDSAALYALGSSGTIYEIDIHDIASECDPVKPETIWQMQMGKAEKIRQNMYELGLFNNK